MMLTNEQILRLALEQSAVDYGCAPEDFLGNTPVFTRSRVHPQARKYLPLPFELDMTSYGSCVVAQCSEALEPAAREYLARYDVAHALETPHLQALDDLIAPFGLKTCFMAEYFLPDVTRLQALDCPYRLELLGPEAFESLYLPQWSDALCEERRHLDVLGVGAYDGEKLVGLAGCSADCETMWQIGVNVLPEYRRQGVAAALTSHLALEILKRGKVPFYCAAWCNLKSVRNAIKCGFRPAWVSVTARKAEFVEKMNRV